MLRHIPELPSEERYPVNDWKIEQRRFDHRYLAQEESIFTVSNGFLGLRGSFEEGRPVSHDETFVNGFYETWPIVYGETAYGFARTGQTMLNVTNAKIIQLYVDEEPFVIDRVQMLSFNRALNMKDGTLDREVIWETASGKRVKVESRRLVSFKHRHLAAIDYRVTLLDEPASVIISSEIFTELGGVAGEAQQEADPRKAKKFQGQVFDPIQNYSADRRVMLAYRTRSSQLYTACGIDHLIEGASDIRESIEDTPTTGRFAFRAEAQPGHTIRLTKFMAYHVGPEYDGGEIDLRVNWSLDLAREQSFDHLLAEQIQYMDDFWNRSDLIVEGGHDRMQQCLRFNVFQLLQATGRADDRGIPAKGLTGQAYEGHYFWDGEIYVLPFLIFTAPKLARLQLEHRYRMLEKARSRARDVNQRGALYPWRTINGEEASAYYAAGTAQYHINADIMHALKNYVEISGDLDFLHDHGAEMLVETARLWLDLGFFQGNGDGNFHIHGVTGPDEYTAVVNDNLYTNLMARENLRYAARVVGDMRNSCPEHFQRLARRVELEPSEIVAWSRAAEAMYVPFDDKLGVHPQDDDFLQKKIWDLASTPRDRFPLMMYYHPLVLYRHQVIKQADVVLAMYLLHDEFTLDQKRKNFNYYEPLTTGDSSLSACIESIIAFEIGDHRKGLDYLRAAILMDLADVGGNVRDGIHIASAGGTWMGIVNGIGGLRHANGHLSFRPRLPDAWERISFRLQVRGQLLEVDIRVEEVTYRLLAGDQFQLHHESEELTITPGQPVTRPISALQWENP